MRPQPVRCGGGVETRDPQYVQTQAGRLASRSVQQWWCCGPIVQTESGMASGLKQRHLAEPLLCDQPEAVRDVPGTHPAQDLSVLCGSSDSVPFCGPRGRGGPAVAGDVADSPLSVRGTLEHPFHRKALNLPVEATTAVLPAGPHRPCSRVRLVPDSPALHLILRGGDPLVHCRLLAAFWQWPSPPAPGLAT